MLIQLNLVETTSVGLRTSRDILVTEHSISAFSGILNNRLMIPSVVIAKSSLLIYLTQQESETKRGKDKKGNKQSPFLGPEK